jgi:hypothetical protein
MLWFYIRCRGQPPRVFLRDNYTGLSKSEIDKLEVAYASVINELLGVPLPGGHDKHEPDGIRSITIPTWKGFTFPAELKNQLIAGLTERLHKAEGIPSGLKIAGYNNLP